MTAPLLRSISSMGTRSLQSLVYVFHPRYKAMTMGAARYCSKKYSASGVASGEGYIDLN